MQRLNCWEFKRCGREPGGERVNDLGACPAADCPHLDGVHRGRQAGRVCWLVAGTMCGGEVQGTFASKLSDCRQCDFYMTVRDEEGAAFFVTVDIINQMTEKGIIT
jgi:hypothetical protein